MQETEKFQVRGDASNPYHLSVGAIVLDEEDRVALIRKPDGVYTLPRETMYSDESLVRAIERGLEEELGVDVVVDRYLGSLIVYFSRPDGAKVEKTTVYFEASKIGTKTKLSQEDEAADEVLWVSAKEAVELLRDQNNKEFQIINRV